MIYLQDSLLGSTKVGKLELQNIILIDDNKSNRKEL